MTRLCGETVRTSAAKRQFYRHFQSCFHTCTIVCICFGDGGWS